MADLEFSDGDKGRFECRSEPLHSDVSSHISRPKWRRLLRAAAQAMGKRLNESQSIQCASDELEAAFDHPDARGGGSEVDIHHCLKQLLLGLVLSDEDVGTILIGMYHFLQADDLPVSSRTWRPLLVTALLASVQLCLRERSEPVKDNLKRAVVHWWPRHKADNAYAVFTARENYKKALLTPSVRAVCYFNLRDQGLAMSASAESTTSAVVSFDQLPPARDQGRLSSRRPDAPPLPAGANIAALHGATGSSRDRPFSSVESSFMLSEDSSWADESSAMILHL